ncbi:Calmodulin [Tritrichomonas foetus]|uniref:Calmodulin n=1 Tax=Tritrichomonas foetus TaxID=1144522 RepID=A0A1J4JR03_9EUKA|nr:Calmodulin [Tritrichomonas foetus]|eukprot:OHT01607.1 Calmodulin [Tritrichomonas foetus]
MNLKDLPKALKAIGIVITTEDFINIQNTVIADEQACIDLPEFISIIYYFLRATDTQEELIRAFAVFDNDHDGKIPIDAMTQILTNLKHSIPKDKVEGILNEMKDDDDMIDYKALIKRLRP